MKSTLLVLVCGLYAATVFAQKAAILSTNSDHALVVTFTNLDGKVFEAVTLGKPTARGVVWTKIDDDDSISGGTIPYSKLHVDILKLFRIEQPEQAERVMVVPVIAGVPAPQPSREWKRVTVQDIVGDSGYWPRCETSEGEVLMKVPARTTGWFQQWAACQQGLAQAQAYAGQAARADATSPTMAGGDLAYVQAAMARRQQANLMAIDARETLENLRNLQARLAASRAQCTTVSARPTGKVYQGLPVWEAVVIPGNS